MSSDKRIVITGMSINTPIGDQLETFYENLIAGKSAVTNWGFVKRDDVYSKVGGELTDYDWKTAVMGLEGKLPKAMYKKLRTIAKKAPLSTKISVLCGARAWLDAGLSDGLDPTRCSTVVAGHNLNEKYLLDNYDVFRDEDPDYIDGMAAVHMLDTDHAGSVSEVLGWQGAAYTMGGACASGNVALRNAIDEVKYHDHDVAMVVGAMLDFSQMGVHAMALMGAITFESFNETPHLASRPYDMRREGFVPSHGAAALVVESLEHALARGATIYAEVMGCTSTSDGNHLPNPSTEGQARTIERVIRRAGLTPEDVDFVCAHATSTPLGDISEINAIKSAFGDHARRLKINAPKSMLGHTCWSAPVVETVAGLMQLKHGKLHPSINIDDLDPEVDLDVCANEPVEHEIQVMLKNSFGFGGLNCCSIYRRFDPGSV